MTNQTVMVPVLVSAAVSVEVMVAVRPPHQPESARRLPEIDGSAVRTALAYVTPEGFTVEEITDWEELPR